jgi:protein-tyrosine phosphatase
MNHSVKKIHILFVCVGNICRSPIAEAAFNFHTDRSGWRNNFEADSAGTTAYHVGEMPDRRATNAAQQYGFSTQSIRARQVVPLDFQKYDLIFAMEKGVLESLKKMQAITPSSKAEVAMYLDYLPGFEGQDVPDPYYKEEKDFERVAELCDKTSDFLLKSLLKKQGLLGCGC